MMWFRFVLAITAIALLSLVWLLFVPTKVAAPGGGEAAPAAATGK